MIECQQLFENLRTSIRRMRVASELIATPARDPGLYVDLSDVGRVLSGPSWRTFRRLGRAYVELRKVDITQCEAGYLPHAIMDGWQQLVTDFAYCGLMALARSSKRAASGTPGSTGTRRSGRC
jgi:hypothetical protein